MKLFVKSACVAFIFTVIFSMLPFQAACADLENDVFRLHILANSDSDEDQALKLKVRDRVLSYTEELFARAKTKVAANEVVKQGYSYPVKAEITNMFFTTRHYDSYTLPAGNYDALRLTIGEGDGHNWWCVMFPALCISSDLSRESRAKENFSDREYEVVKNEKREYKFFAVEFFEKIFSSFS